jgi:hypothetical protein
MAQVVEHLQSKLKTLGSNPSNAKLKIKTKVECTRAISSIPLFFHFSGALS